MSDFSGDGERSGVQSHHRGGPGRGPGCAQRPGRLLLPGPAPVVSAHSQRLAAGEASGGGGGAGAGSGVGPGSGRGTCGLGSCGLEAAAARPPRSGSRRFHAPVPSLSTKEGGVAVRLPPSRSPAVAPLPQPPKPPFPSLCEHSFIIALSACVLDNEVLSVYRFWLLRFSGC